MARNDDTDYPGSGGWSPPPNPFESSGGNSGTPNYTNPWTNDSTHNPVGSSIGYGTGQNPPTGGGGGGGAAAGAGGAAAGYGDYALDSLHLSANGHLFGEKRVISGDPSKPGQTRYDYQTVDLGDASTPEGLAAIAASTTIPADILTQRLSELKVQNAQTMRQGNGSIIGQNADGSYSYFDRQGNIQQTADPAALAAQGIQQPDILRAQTERMTGQRTTTQAGQYSVAGMNADGTVALRDFYGNVTNVPAAQAATMPGVTQSAMMQARSDYTQGVRTQTQAGQYEAVGFNPDGTVSVRDYYGNVKNVTPQQASGLPGITAGTLQYMQQQENTNQFLGSAVPNYGAMVAAGQQIPGGTPPPGGQQMGAGAGLPGSGQSNAPAGADSGAGAYAAAGPNSAGAGLPGSGQSNAPAGADSGAGAYAAAGPNSAGAGQYAGGGGPGGPGAYGTYGAQSNAPEGQPAGAPQPISGGTGQYAGGGGETQRDPGSAGAPTPTPTQQANYSSYSAQSSPSTSSAGAPGAAYGTAGSGPTSGGPRYGQVGMMTQAGGARGYGGYSAAGFSGTQQGLQQANQGLSNYYQYGQNQFNIAHQAQDQQNTAYRYNQTQTEAQNAGQSRNLSGMGWAGITKPVIAGTT